jgi:uncharacterized protein
MKSIILLTINIYQKFISAVLKNILGVNRMCRFSPTCSEYAKIQIEKKGIFTGFKKSAIRILKCQPYFNF